MINTFPVSRVAPLRERPTGAGSNRGNFGDEDAGESRDDESGSERAGEGEGDGEKITEEEMSGLYSRISAMREREVEVRSVSTTTHSALLARFVFVVVRVSKRG